MSSGPKDWRKPFACHGVEFFRENDTQYIGVCSTCGKPKFYVNKQTGLWDCKVCHHSGNLGQFLDRTQEEYRGQATERLRRALEKRLGLRAGGVPESVGFNGESFTFLACDAKGHAVDLRMRPLRKGITRSTDSCTWGMVNARAVLTGSKTAAIVLVEGESDYLAVRQALGLSVIVVALPGSHFKAEWAPLFAGRHVIVVLDHDKAGRDGEQAVHRHLVAIAASLLFVHWPDDLPDKFDVRDWLTQGRSWKSLKRLLLPEPRLGVPESKVSSSVLDPEAVERLKERYIYVGGVDEFVEKRTRRRFEPSALDKRHASDFPLGKKSGSNSASHSFHNSSGPTVDVITYRPVRLTSVEEFEASDPCTVERDVDTGERLRAINVYRPSELIAAALEIEPDSVAELVGPWLDVGRQMFGHDVERLLDHAAFTLQCPEQKANWHPWIISPEGSGKDTFFKPYFAGVGDHNRRSIQGKTLNSQWTDWAERAKLVVVRDIAKLIEDDWHTLKNLLTHPPEMVQINTKFKRLRWIPNLMNFVFMTNNDDAIPLTADGRRLLVLTAKAPTRDPEDPKRPYDADTFNRYVERDDVHIAVTRLLLDRQLDAAQMRGNAPHTAAKQLAIEANESDLEASLRRMHDAREGPFARELLSVPELKATLSRSILPAPSEQAIGHALRRTKLAVRLGKQARNPDTHKKEKVWATTAVDFYDRLTDVQLCREYERQRRLLSFASTPEWRKQRLQQPALRIAKDRRAR